MIAAWIVPSAVLVALPKCPLCLAAYVALFSGIRLSWEGASAVRASLLLASAVALVVLSWQQVLRWAVSRKTRGS